MNMEKEETSSAHTPFVELALIETEIKYRIKLTIENPHTNNLEVHSVFDGLIRYYSESCVRQQAATMQSSVP